MVKKLHVDIETYSSIDIASCGSYKYMESIDFEILMVAYAFDEQPVKIVDLSQGEKLPQDFLSVLQNPDIIKKAHNANFERRAFKTYGYDIPAEQWYCTSVKSAYCGLPLSLGEVSKALDLEEKGKSATGKALIRYFCCPIKPTKANGMRERNFPSDNLEKWEEFKDYCKQDVEAEREIDNRLSEFEIPEFERENYFLDQKINDKGILIDLIMAQNAYTINDKFSKELVQKAKQLTGLDNPNSPAQLKDWLSREMQKEIKTLAKDTIEDLIKEAGPGPAAELLKLRKKMSKTSVKKYIAMLSCALESGRGHGFFQFYGANRTGRSAGRLVQMHNLPKNKMKDLAEAREVIASGDYDLATLLYDDIPSLLSELIRTTFIASPGHTFPIADFSAIEARVIAWLAGEKWRLDVFKTHGKIYEASAAMMFGIPIEEVTKGSSMRDKGKVAELALGFQGAIGALKKMGGEKMGLSDTEMNSIVKKWRKASPAIVKLWADIEKAAVQAIKIKNTIVIGPKNIEFESTGKVLTIKLPSGRKLYYQNPVFTVNKWDKQSIRYKGLNQETKQWGWVDTYGGKLTENIVQAIARDLLMRAMVEIDKEGLSIVLHVHDEIVCETPENEAEEALKIMCDIMGQEAPWATGLPLGADGYITNFYKKD